MDVFHTESGDECMHVADDALCGHPAMGCIVQPHVWACCEENIVNIWYESEAMVKALFIIED